jgi:chitinase
VAHLLSERPIAHASESHASVVEINGDGGGEDGGQVQFNELITQGALIRNEPDAGNNAVVYTSSGGFTRLWDDCSSTPFLRSEAIHQIISYDDPMSLGMKAAFAVRVGMLGVNMFDVHGDSAQWDLTDSVRRNLGLVDVPQSP